MKNWTVPSFSHESCNMMNRNHDLIAEILTNSNFQKQYCCHLTLWLQLKLHTFSLHPAVGGRLQRELDYTEKTLGAGEGTTNQLVLQTSRTEGANLLKKEALLQHLESTKLATQVEVELDNV